MNSGIYKITNLINGKIYIGSSINLKRRMNEHLRELRLNIHSNKRLQNSYNKYGEENFKTEVVEYCDINKVREREQFYIDNYLPYLTEIGYNISNCSTGGNTGNSESHPKAKLNWEKVNEIRNSYKLNIYNMEELSDLYEITIQGIWLIIKNKNWHDKNYVPPSENEMCKKKCSRKKIDELVRNVRLDYINGKTVKELSAKYNLNNQIVLSYLTYRTHFNNDLDLKEDCLKTKKNSRLPSCMQVNQYDLEGKYIRTWDSMIDATNATGAVKICECCKGKRQTSGGYKWKYADKEG